jgi:hypothetical protein
MTKKETYFEWEWDKKNGLCESVIDCLNMKDNPFNNEGICSQCYAIHLGIGMK